MQIIGKPWEDHIVLAFAKKAQEVLGIPSVVNVKAASTPAVKESDKGNTMLS